MSRKHAHYFRSVSHLDEIDIYRFLDLFGVTDQALGHAIKKLVAPGGRGAGKDFRKDVQEAIDTLQRRLEMLDEDEAKNAVMEVNGTSEHIKCCGQPHDCSNASCVHRADVMMDDQQGWSPVLGMTRNDIVSLDSRRVQLRDADGIIYEGPADSLRWYGSTHYRLLP